MSFCGIHTTLELNPCDNFCNYTTITKGATAELTFDFNNYSYLEADPWDTYIEKVTFLLKWPNKKPITFVYDCKSTDEKQLQENERFAYDADLNCLSCLLTSTETSSFDTAYDEDPVLFEIALQVDTDALIGQKVDSVIIERQPPIVVVDSLYSESLNNKR